MLEELHVFTYGYMHLVLTRLKGEGLFYNVYRVEHITLQATVNTSKLWQTIYFTEGIVICSNSQTLISRSCWNNYTK